MRVKLKSNTPKIETPTKEETTLFDILREIDEPNKKEPPQQKAEQPQPQVLSEMAANPETEMAAEIIAAYKELGGREYLKIMSKIKPELFFKLLTSTMEQQAKLQQQTKQIEATDRRNYPSVDTLEKPAILKIA